MGYTDYPFIMDITTVIFAIAGYGVHIFLAVVQGILIVYLLLSGILNLAYMGQNSKLLRIFGLVAYANEEKRKFFGSLKIGLGILLLLPSVLGMPFLVSGGAAFIAIFYLIYQEKQIPSEQKRPGIFMRGMAISIAVISTAFIFFEDRRRRPRSSSVSTRVRTAGRHPPHHRPARRRRPHRRRRE